jgi:hypothetical protein
VAQPDGFVPFPRLPSRALASDLRRPKLDQGRRRIFDMQAILSSAVYWGSLMSISAHGKDHHAYMFDDDAAFSSDLPLVDHLNSSLLKTVKPKRIPPCLSLPCHQAFSNSQQPNLKQTSSENNLNISPLILHRPQ